MNIKTICTFGIIIGILASVIGLFTSNVPIFMCGAIICVVSGIVSKLYTLFRSVDGRPSLTWRIILHKVAIVGFTFGFITAVVGVLDKNVDTLICGMNIGVIFGVMVGETSCYDGDSTTDNNNDIPD